jgi:predicted negative regulator of RcsB-dependent stress response
MAAHFDLEEQEQLAQLKHFWNTWGNWITALVMACSLGVIAYTGYGYWQNRQAQGAAAMYDLLEQALVSKDAAKIERAFDDMRQNFKSATSTQQGALQVAAFHQENKQLDKAIEILKWSAQAAGDDAHKDLATLRLAALLLETKRYEEALGVLASAKTTGFSGLFADLRGDGWSVQGQNEKAIEAYRSAHAALEFAPDYRRLVQAKLVALGVEVGSTTGASGGAQ